MGAFKKALGLGTVFALFSSGASSDKSDGQDAKKNIIQNAFALLSFRSVAAQPVATKSAHANEQDRQYLNPQKFKDCTDQNLQDGLTALIAKLGLTEAVQDKKLSLAVADITDLRYPKLAMLNGNQMMYAASLPKIAILLGAIVEIENGTIKPDQDLWADMTAMIRYSDNGAATRVLEKVGEERLLEILQSPRFKLYDRETNGGLWVGKRYAKGTAYKRDPLHNLSHGATPFQVARFYYLLESGRLAGPALTKKMKGILSNPGIHHKFVKGLADKTDAKIYRKSGSWRTYHSDSALIDYQGRKYVITALANDPQGGKWIEQLASPLLDLAAKQTVSKAPVCTLPAP